MPLPEYKWRLEVHASTAHTRREFSPLPKADGAVYNQLPDGRIETWMPLKKDTGAPYRFIEYAEAEAALARLQRHNLRVRYRIAPYQGRG